MTALFVYASSLTPMVMMNKNSLLAQHYICAISPDVLQLALEWGKSKPNSLEFNLKLSEISKDKILGAVLGQANMEEMAKNYGHSIYPEYTKL